MAARELNARGRVAMARAALAAGAAASLAGLAAGLAGPWTSGLEPTLHVYPAIVWTLAIWTAALSGIYALAQLYALARSLAGRMTPQHGADNLHVTG